MLGPNTSRGSLPTVIPRPTFSGSLREEREFSSEQKQPQPDSRSAVINTDGGKVPGRITGKKWPLQGGLLAHAPARAWGGRGESGSGPCWPAAATACWLGLPFGTFDRLLDAGPLNQLIHFLLPSIWALGELVYSGGNRLREVYGFAQGHTANWSSTKWLKKEWFYSVLNIILFKYYFK